MQVSPGPDGTTTWWAQLPAGPSAAAWAAVSELGDRYAAEDAALTVDRARADAFLDLLLTNVTVSAKVTIGIPVITGDDADAARRTAAVRPPTDDTTAGSAADDAWPVATGGLGLGDDFKVSTALSGCEMKGIGWIDADTVEALLAAVPTDVGRALIDARTGTLMETVSNAHRPPKALTHFVATRDGTCRMWGCDRPAVQCDVDHARPWPHGPTSPGNLGGLCRRHHRLKQRRRWTYELARDGTATWSSPSGTQRITQPDHAAMPPPQPTRGRAQAPRPQDRELVAAAPPPF